MKTLLELLGQTKLFKGLPETMLSSIAQRMVRKDYNRGDQIQSAGAPFENLLLIGDGLLEELAPDPETGVDFPVGFLHPGELIGVLEGLTHEPSLVTIRAAATTRTFQLSVPLFRQLFKAPEIGAFVSSVLAKELQERQREPGLKFVDLSRQAYRQDLYQLIPSSILVLHRAIPIKTRDTHLMVAMVNPANRPAIDDIQRAAKGYTVEPVAISEEAYRAFYQKHLASTAHKPDHARQSRAAGSEPATAANIEYVSYDQPVDASRSAPIMGQEVVRLVSSILLEAIQHDASDIHIEAMSDKLQVRYRVDGRLQRFGQPVAMDFYAPLVARLKVLAKLDIAEKRLPQEGRFSIKLGRRRLDFRVSCIPTKIGEKLVLRVLDPSNLMGGLEKIIAHPQTVEVVREMILRPYGIVFITGPTGSGKSTTLYSVLSERTNDSVNVVTVEDPIEYDVPEIIQTQVNEGIGLGFATLLRAFLRQDPDVILVGETRDKVTAKTALEAALTGRFVMTSLHTNNSISSIFRLQDMGMDPFLIANAMIGVISQRLLRRLCPECRREVQGKHVLLDQFNARATGAEPLTQCHFARGCPACKWTGYSGRVAALEVFRVNEEIKSLIVGQATQEMLQEAGLRHGMIPFASYCRFLVSQGITSLEEALSTLGDS